MYSLSRIKNTQNWRYRSPHSSAPSLECGPCTKGFLSGDSANEAGLDPDVIGLPGGIFGGANAVGPIGPAGGGPPPKPGGCSPAWPGPLLAEPCSATMFSIYRITNAQNGDPNPPHSYGPQCRLGALLLDSHHLSQTIRIVTMSSRGVKSQHPPMTGTVRYQTIKVDNSTEQSPKRSS